MSFLSWEQPIQKHGERLPHWQQGQGTQFVTFRLGDALPVSRLTLWREQRCLWIAEHPLPWSEDDARDYRKAFTARIEAWLDEGMGSCVLRRKEVREILAEVLMRFQGERVKHYAWVIMPNHVHLLFTPLSPVNKLMQAWKAQSARLIGKGSIWQRNYRDTMIRDAHHLENVLRYIRNNPIKAKLPEGEYTLWEGRHSVDP